MRRILVESARRKIRLKRGGGSTQAEVPDDLPAPAAPVEDVLAVGEALDELAAQNTTAGELVKLHYFVGFTIEESADLLGISHRTAYRTWAFARAWLFRTLGGTSPGENSQPS
jgi:RNA polymerase sigma factor (TIGR02999 family)